MSIITLGIKVGGIPLYFFEYSDTVFELRKYTVLRFINICYRYFIITNYNIKIQKKYRGVSPAFKI